MKACKIKMLLRIAEEGKGQEMFQKGLLATTQMDKRASWYADRYSPTMDRSGILAFMPYIGAEPFSV